MKIAVTGANGYIGRHVVEAARVAGHTVVRIGRRHEASVKTEGEYVQCDVLCHAASPELYKMIGYPDALIHLAWSDGFSHNDGSHLDNLPAHLHFISNIIDNGCTNVNVMGSMHEVGYHEGKIQAETPCNPSSLYGIAKNALRQACAVYSRDKKISFKWLRGFYITGDDEHNHSIFSRILQLARTGVKTFPFTQGTNKYDFIDVHELACQIVQATVQREVTGIIHVCSGKPIALKDRVESFIAEHKLSIVPNFGAYPDRPYDSPEIWGDVTAIKTIIQNAHRK